MNNIRKILCASGSGEFGEELQRCCHKTGVHEFCFKKNLKATSKFQPLEGDMKHVSD
jgi:hypothetical protein